MSEQGINVRSKKGVFVGKSLGCFLFVKIVCLGNING